MTRLSASQVRHHWLWLCGALALMLGTYLAVQMLLAVSGTQPQQRISRGVEFLPDATSRMQVQDMLDNSSLHWQTEQSDLLSYGMQKVPYWFRYQLPRLDSREKWLLEIDYALLDNLEVWFFDDQGLLSEYATGDSLPFRARTIRSEKFLFPVPQSPGPVDLLIRAQSSGSLKLPINLWQAEHYLVYSGEHSLMMGIFFGFLAAMGLSNFFFFLTTRAVNFLVYCGYVFCLGLTLLTLHGLAYKYLWPENIWLQGRSVVLFASATMLFAAIFSRELLPVRRFSMALDRGLLMMAGLFLMILLLGLLLPYWLTIKVFLIVLIIAIFFICGIGFWLWSKGVVVARLYTLAWVALLSSALIASLENLNLLDLDIRSHYLLMFGATVETVLLALVLAISYNQQRQDLFEAQERMLHKERQLREAQQQAQDDLEYKVQERTLELEITLRELSQSNRELEERNTLDALTGIRNRRYFDKKYIAEVRRSRREQTLLTVAMLDIDHFKSINDRLGHLVGDECIRAVANQIRLHLRRPADDVCRYGGEEFALLLPNTDAEGAAVLLEAIRQDIGALQVHTPAGPVSLTISVGFSTGAVHMDVDDNELLEQADQALYRAKAGGRNQVQTYNKESGVA